MNKEKLFRVLGDNQSHRSYHLQKKTYASGETVAKENNQQENILFLTSDPDVLYVPAYAAAFAFDTETTVFELSLPGKSKSMPQPDNPASPFYLTGDACFYNFMARKIKVNETISFYHKKGTDFLWLLSGNITLEADGQQQKMEKNQLVLIEKNDTAYEIAGNGEIFLLKL